MWQPVRFTIDTGLTGSHASEGEWTPVSGYDVK